MIIHSFDTFGEVRHLDPATGMLTPAAISSTGGPPAVHGHYGRLGDTLVLLYRMGADLYLRIGETVVLVDKTTSITYRRVKDHWELEVTDESTGDVTARVEYSLPEPIVAPEEDPTPFAEPEDFDFGLFISNVVNNAERMSLIYRG